MVIGLETLESYGALGEICRAVGGDRVAFSLDLHNGTPVTRAAIPADEPIQTLAARAVDAGVGSLILIDLARIGLGEGLDLVLVERVRRTCPDLTVLAGGGVSGMRDLQRLADAGCDGALVATVLHDGRLGAAEIATARRLKPRRSREA